MKHALNWRVILLLLSFGLTLPSSAVADRTKALSLDEVLLNLKSRQESLATFIADFQQVQQNELFAEPQTSAGTLFFDRVGKLLIKTRQPEPYLVLLVEGKMISGVPGSVLRQKNLPGGKTFLKKMLDLVQTGDQMKKKFHIQPIPTFNAHRYELVLKPIKVNRRMPYAEIQAEIDTQLWLPVNLQLIEPAGDSVRFIFRFTAINSPLPEGIFNVGPIDVDSSTSDDTRENR